jgi:hypothetical protein
MSPRLLYSEPGAFSQRGGRGPPVRIELYSAMLVSGVNPVLPAPIHHTTSRQIPVTVLKPCSRFEHSAGGRPASTGTTPGSRATLVMQARHNGPLYRVR